MVPPLKTISLFTGAAGLELGLKLSGIATRCVCYVEREAYAVANLLARIEAEDLDVAPIWSDVATFDGRPWRGTVDLITGGFPCKNVSNAGDRSGLAGAKSGLWREYRRIVAEVQPRLVFVENVAALVNRGLAEVLSDLAGLGFDAEWCCVRASDFGAPHGRNRVFILAHSERDPGRDEQRRRSGEGGPGEAAARGVGVELADPHHHHRQPQRQGPQPVIGRWARNGSVCFPPGPGDFDRWAKVLEERPDLEPSVRRVADGLANRLDRLRLCGNGVVPTQAAWAFRHLIERFG